MMIMSALPQASTGLRFPAILAHAEFLACTASGIHYGGAGSPSTLLRAPLRHAANNPLQHAMYARPPSCIRKPSYM